MNNTHYAYRIWGRNMKARDLERILRSDGWYEVGQVGSHKHFKHSTKKGKITIPMHKGDLKIKTADSILNQAGIDRSNRRGK